ncbi:hypothetical protein BC833DRAFT_572629 [Globomyces pollinis-pini]|nr:hypothetical protein BC833DRAFT_572629 [Globomyces pollinis-pini]
MMVAVLQNICKACARVMVDEQYKRSTVKKLRDKGLDSINRKLILKNLNVLCKKTSICPHCSAINGAIKKVGPLKLIHDKFKKKTKMTEEEAKFRDSFRLAAEIDPYIKSYLSKAVDDLNPLVVLGLFERISNEDCELMGLDHQKARPEEFLWTSFPIPPVCIRPSVGQETSSTEDDITILASEIIDVNCNMEACIKDGTKVELLNQYWEFLQLQSAMYITSDLPGVPNHLQMNLNKIKKGFCQRLKGKQGRFRGNLSGKRVDFSGRTVISPDPNLRIDQVALPERVCKILTYPEMVNDHNIDRLRQNVLNGPDKHPGALFVTTSNGFKRFLKYGAGLERAAQNLRVGDIVDRHVQDNDVVLFNRQPSLHKLSIMSHFVKVRPWRTFRFNECVCAPYNADFDGDEMNIHVPQTEEARAEAVHLMGIKANLVTPRNGEPLIAATQDFITASYLLSRRDVFYDRSQFSQICCYLADAGLQIDVPQPAIVKPVQLWTGKQIFGILLKPNSSSKVNVNLETKCRTFGRDEKHKKTGVTFSGYRDENGKPYDNSLCPNDGWLVIHNSEVMCGVIDKSIIGDGNKKSMFYVVYRDFGSVEAANCMNKIAKLTSRWFANRGFSIGIDDVQPGKKLIELKAKTVSQGDLDCNEMIRKSKAGELPNQPGCTQETTLETKLSGILSKIRDDVGTVCFAELNKYNAPLTMSLCGSKGSKINVSQMVACVGQQIISGKRIPDGFGDRSLPHFAKKSKLPSAKGFVANSFYSGLTPTEFLFHAVSGREGLVDTAVKTAETGYMSRRLMKALEDLVCHYDLSVRDSIGGVVQFRYGDDGLDPAMIEDDTYPVEFMRTLKHTINSIPIKKNQSSLTYQQARTLMDNELKKPMFKKCSNAYIDAVKAFVEKEVIKKLKWISTTSELAPKNPITKEQLSQFLFVCGDKYLRAMIEPGTAVGAIGAQSIGEPGTQMTLKTFHFAGVASMSITLGVPRIKEIINAAKKIATPIIKAPLLFQIGNYEQPIPYIPQTRFAAETATRVVKGRVEKTTLNDVLEFMQEIITGYDTFLRVRVNLEAIRQLQLDVNISTIRWSIITSKKLKISDAHIKLESSSTLRITVANGKTDSTNVYMLMQALKRALPKVVIKGLANAGRAVINDNSKEKKLELMVEGYGLREIMGTDGVDGLKCTSNHIDETLKSLGIEAARETIVFEIANTMSNHGLTVDRRHLMLLGDLMTFKGEILGITRFGIAKMKESVLMLASFENTTDHLFDASFFGKHDTIQGVSECIIMGQPMSLGSGIMKLLQYVDQPTQELKKPRHLLFDLPENHKPLR